MARTGMTAILEELRSMCEAGTSEYTIGTTLYWSDNTLQDILDSNRRDYTFQPLQSYPVIVSGGTLQYFEYRAPYSFFEATSGGTSIFYLQDSTGATLGTALWSADYRRGVFTFASDAKGTAIYFTGRSYDMNSAAADVWRRKASHYAPTSFDFSTDNHSVSRQQVYSHAIEMADFFENLGSGSIQTIPMFRSDV